MKCSHRKCDNLVIKRRRYGPFPKFCSHKCLRRAVADNYRKTHPETYFKALEYKRRVNYSKVWREKQKTRKSWIHHYLNSLAANKYATQPVETS